MPGLRSEGRENEAHTSHRGSDDFRCPVGMTDAEAEVLTIADRIAVRACQPWLGVARLTPREETGSADMDAASGECQPVKRNGREVFGLS